MKFKAPQDQLKSRAIAIAKICLTIVALVSSSSTVFAQKRPRPGNITKVDQVATQQTTASGDRSKINQKVFRKPPDPEAAGLLLNLLARYASNVSDKTDLDRRIEAALGDTPGSRQIAQNVVDQFQSIPLRSRQELYGEYANVTTRQFESSRYDAAIQRLFQISKNTETAGEQRHSKAMSIGTEPTYKFNYKGIACFRETTNDQLSGSDEIYLITSVVTFENGQPVTQTFMRGIYAPFDEGGAFADQLNLYEGYAQRIDVISVMMEQDFGDAKEQRDMIDTVVKAVITWAYGVVTGTPPPGFVQKLIGLASGEIANFIVNVLDLKDDLIEEKHFMLTYDQLVAFGVSKPSNSYAGIDYHFDELHEGDGGMYRTYYDVERIDPPIPDFEHDPPEARGFFPAIETSPEKIEGMWGDMKIAEDSKIVVRITGTPSRSGTFKVTTTEQIIKGDKVVSTAEGLQLTNDGTWNYLKPLYDTTTISKDVPGGSARGTGGVLGGTSEFGSKRRGSDSGNGRVPGGHAYTLILPNNVRVQVFMEDRPPEELKNQRIRYVRLSDSGQVVADVMLRPTQPRP